MWIARPATLLENKNVHGVTEMTTIATRAKGAAPSIAGVTADKWNAVNATARENSNALNAREMVK